MILFSPLFQFLFTKKLKQYFFLLRVKCVCVLLCVFVLFFFLVLWYMYGFFLKNGGNSLVVNFIPVIDRGSSMGDFKCVYVCIDILSLSNDSQAYVTSVSPFSLSMSLTCKLLFFCQWGKGQDTVKRGTNHDVILSKRLPTFKTHKTTQQQAKCWKFEHVLLIRIWTRKKKIIKIKIKLIIMARCDDRFYES